MNSPTRTSTAAGVHEFGDPVPMRIHSNPGNVKMTDEPQTAPMSCGGHRQRDERHQECEIEHALACANQRACARHLSWGFEATTRCECVRQAGRRCLDALHTGLRCTVRLCAPPPCAATSAGRLDAWASETGEAGASHARRRSGMHTRAHRLLRRTWKTRSSLPGGRRVGTRETHLENEIELDVCHRRIHGRGQDHQRPHEGLDHGKSA